MEVEKDLRRIYKHKLQAQVAEIAGEVAECSHLPPRAAGAEQMGLKSNPKGMEETGHQWENQVSLMEKEKSHLKTRKAFLFLKDPTHKCSSNFM